MLLVAAVNLGLVVFNFSYFQLRDFYVLNTPQVARWYDPVKGVEPHRDTKDYYLDKVDQLEQLWASPTPDPQVEANLLKGLREQSVKIVSESPFELADKQGTLERIKNRIRAHMNPGMGKANLSGVSSKKSFLSFWTAENFRPERRAAELAFFNSQVRPLFMTNYYRTYGEDGEFVDQFWWQYDRWFLLVFAVELVLRVLITKMRYKSFTFSEALGRHWYDVLNLIPAVNLIPSVHLGWLGLARAIPFGYRLHRVGLLPADSLVVVLIRRYSHAIADEVTDQVIVNLISQAQSAIRQGDFNQLVSPTQTAPIQQRPGTTDKFVGRQTRLVVERVLPKVRPEVEAFLHHSIEQAIPLTQRLPDRITEGLVDAVVNSAYGAAAGTLKADPEGEKLTRQLIEKLLLVLRTEWRVAGTATEIQTVLIEALEGIKLDYIRNNKMSSGTTPTRKQLNT